MKHTHATVSSHRHLTSIKDADGEPGLWGDLWFCVRKERKKTGGGGGRGGNINWKKEFLTSTGFGLGLQCILYLLWRGSRQSWQCHRNWTENVKYCWNFEGKPYYLTNFVVFLNCSVPRGGLLVVSASASWCRFWFYMGIHVFQENNKCHPKTTGCRIFFIFSLLF